jgi:poly-gamma-glutamate synthesis protein (capsule biosynthesis protein)
MSPSVTLALTGDVMLGRGVNQALRHHGPAYPWGDLLPWLTGADLTVVNLECVIAQGGHPWSRWPKVFHFRADPIAVTALKQAGINCVTLANNHVLDFETDALREMVMLLRRAGIAFTGAGCDLAEARRPVVLEARGLRVGILAFTDNEPGWAATPDAPGTNYIPIALNDAAMGPVREGIAQARSAGADLVVFTIHWGPNMIQRPSTAFRSFAHAIIDAGADLFLGHSAHIFQGIELHRGRPIIYDAGDFVDDYAVDPKLRNDWGLLFQLEADRAGFHRIELTPLVISHCQVNRAVGPDREAILERITELTAELGSTVRLEFHRHPVVYASAGEPRA